MKKQKRLLAMLAGLIMSIGIWAQPTPSDISLAKSQMSIERKAVFSENMNLTEDQSVAFWQIYDAYDNEKSNLYEQELLLIVEFAENFENLSDEQAQNIVARSMALQKKNLQLLNRFQKKINRELDAKLAFRFVQIEDQINTLININYLEIPLVQN